MTLSALENKAKECFACGLSKTRTNVVFGRGNPEARIVFVGEAPGQEEDITGLPFVGPAGQLLTRLFTYIGLKESDYYICNIIKCRPPKNRLPLAEEISACHKFLELQLSLIEPEIVVAVGKTAAQTLSPAVIKVPMHRLSGTFGTIEEWTGTPKLGFLYHPAFLLRLHDSELRDAKIRVHNDLKKLLEGMF